MIRGRHAPVLIVQRLCEPGQWSPAACTITQGHSIVTGTQWCGAKGSFAIIVAVAAFLRPGLLLNYVSL